MYVTSFVSPRGTGLRSGSQLVIGTVGLIFGHALDCEAEDRETAVRGHDSRILGRIVIPT